MGFRGTLEFAVAAVVDDVVSSLGLQLYCDDAIPPTTFLAAAFSPLRQCFLASLEVSEELSLLPPPFWKSLSLFLPVLSGPMMSADFPF